jgi:hypothetical protein
MYGYQERALRSEKMLTILQIGRRLGKTEFCMKVLTKGFNRRIVFLSKYPGGKDGCKMVVDRIRTSYPDLISAWSYSPAYVALRNGNTVRLYNHFSKEEIFCGFSADTLVIDDADWCDAKILPNLFAMMSGFHDPKVYVVGAYQHKDTIMHNYIDRLHPLHCDFLDDVHVEEYNWLDHIAFDQTKAEIYRDIQLLQSPDLFIKENGPWGFLGYDNKTNRQLVRFLIPN